MKNLLVILGVLSLFVFVFYGCGGDDGSENGKDNKNEEEVTEDKETDKPETDTDQSEESDDDVIIEVPEEETWEPVDDEVFNPDPEECDPYTSDLEDTQFDDALCSMNIEKWCLEEEVVEYLKGVWVQELRLVADAKVPVVNDITTTTMKYVRVVISEEDGHLVIREMIPCTMETLVTEGNAIAKTIKTTFPRKFMTHFTYHGPQDLKEPLPCLSFSGTLENFNLRFNKWYEMRGAYYQGEEGTTPFDIETEMVTDSDDPRIFDQDEDGRPGVTFEIQSSIASGLIWGVIKNFMELTVINGSGTQLKGPANWDEVNHIIDVSNILFAGDRTINARADRSSFKMVKLEEELSCEEIVPMLKDLFSF